jgi:chromosome partitioning protein
MVSHKGGTGKTTVTLNLGAECAAAGLRVVLLDCDPQGALAAALGITIVSKPTLYEVMTGNCPLIAAIKTTRVERLQLVAADLDLSGLEVELPRRQVWQTSLSSILEGLEGFDLAVIDTPPGLGVLSYVALVASTVALVLTPPEFLAYRALRLALETVERAQRQSPKLRSWAIVPTMMNRQTRHAREVVEIIQEDYGDRVLSEVPRRVAVQDAALSGLPIREYAPGSDAAVAFAQLAKEVIALAQTTKST